MKKTTVKELKEIIKGIKIPKRELKAIRTDIMTPELQAAINDPEAYEKYLKENYPEIINSHKKNNKKQK